MAIAGSAEFHCSGNFSVGAPIWVDVCSAPGTVSNNLRFELEQIRSDAIPVNCLGHPRQSPTGLAILVFQGRANEKH